MAYILEHTKLYACWWDLVALIILIAVVALFVYKYLNSKKVEDSLKDELDELKKDDTKVETAG